MMTPAELHAVRVLQAAGVQHPTKAQCWAHMRGESERALAAFVASKATWPAPEAPKPARMIPLDFVDSDYQREESMGDRMKRVRATTNAKRRSRAEADGKARVDAFEAGMRWGEPDR